MSKYLSCNGYHIVQRFDKSWAVYAYGWWPDDYLDNNPEANRKYLKGTMNWRAKGWYVVHVAYDLPSAKRWALGIGAGE